MLDAISAIPIVSDDGPRIQRAFSTMGATSRLPGMNRQNCVTHNAGTIGPGAISHVKALITASVSNTMNTHHANAIFMI